MRIQRIAPHIAFLLLLQACAQVIRGPETKTPVSAASVVPDAATPTQTAVQGRDLSTPPSASSVPSVTPTVTLVSELREIPREETASPLPTSTPLLASESRQGLIKGRSGYESPFELRYDKSVWYEVPGRLFLSHRSIRGCVVNWSAGGRGAEGARLLSQAKKQIGDYEAEFRAFWDIGLMTFAFTLPEGYYLFEVDFASRVRRQVMEQCRAEVEKLLEGFAPLREGGSP
ncbi:MAG: hypothetical protein RMJ86_09300 [Anaerolineae bacterium]|nr:hypothetical protein [Anaerolineae bacterium]